MNNVKMPWWVKPHKLLLFFLVPAYVLVYCAKPSQGNYFTFTYFLMGLTYLLVYAFASFFGSRTRIRHEIRPFLVDRVYLDLLFLVTVFAYVVWFGKVFLHPSLFIDIMLGRLSNVRWIVNRTPGITSLTQLGVVYSIFYMNQRDQIEIRTRKRYKFYLVVVILLALFRVIAWSEREAIIETVVPILLIAVRNRKRPIFNKTLSVFPYLGIGLLYSFFTATEYFRSWRYYHSFYNDFFYFEAQRLSDYYYTSLNNGAGLLTFYQWPTGNFENILSGLYAFPYVGKYLTAAYGSPNYGKQFLSDYGVQQFNNWSGIFTVFQDIGIIALVFATVLGFVTGMTYRAFVRNDGLGSALYPVIFMSVLEVMRFLYLSNSRAFPIVLFIVIGSVLFRQRQRCEPIRTSALDFNRTLLEPDIT